MKAALRIEDLEAARAYHRRQETSRRQAREARRRERLEAARRAIVALAPAEASLRAIYLFGSILQAGRFSERSAVDVDSDDPPAESQLWRALEEAHHRRLPSALRRFGELSAVDDHGQE